MANSHMTIQIDIFVLRLSCVFLHNSEVERIKFFKFVLHVYFVRLLCKTGKQLHCWCVGITASQSDGLVKLSELLTCITKA